MIANDFLSQIFMDREWKRGVRIANKILSSTELAFWREHSRSKQVLFKFWVAKEATYKMASRQSTIPRTFAPKSLSCQFVDEDQFRSQYESHTYSGECLSNEKGLLAVIQLDPKLSTNHFWVPYKTGQRAGARHTMLSTLKESHPACFEAIAPSDFTRRDHAELCRSYCAPWGVCSFETGH